MLKQNFIYKWKAQNNVDSQCQIQVFIGSEGGKKKTIVIATDAITTGNSVTNESEVIATDMIERLSISPNDLIFIEHYEKQILRPEEFSLVEFEWDSKNRRLQNPIWKELCKSEVEGLIGQKL